MAHLSVVIPVYKAEAYLEELYKRLRAAVLQVTRDYELILVEDCGGDGSWGKMKALARKDRRLKAVQLSRNFGQHYAITAGLDHAKGDWVVVMDCDLQDRPEEIPRLYAKALEGYDVVLACRIGRQDKFLKRFFSAVFYHVFNLLTGLHYDGQVGNFRIVSNEVVRALGGMRENLRFFGGLVDWLGFSTAKIEVQHAESARGATTYTWYRLFRLGTEAIIAYTNRPLWAAVLFGIFIAAVSLILAGYIFAKVLFNQSPVPGWGSLFVLVSFLGGMTIAFLGLLGIYVGKIFDEAKKRPLYVIRNSRNL